jgi:hypothetical protein
LTKEHYGRRLPSFEQAFKRKKENGTKQRKDLSSGKETKEKNGKNKEAIVS